MKQTKRSFLTGGQMRTPVTFYEAKPDDGFMPGESPKADKYYQCFANVYPPSQKDLDMTDRNAKITMVTYLSIGRYITDDMYFEINLPRYKGKFFNVISVEDDTEYHRNIKIIGENRS